MADETCYVLDTTAFIAKLPLYAPMGRAYTTPSVVSEVRDEESRAGSSIALELGRFEVVQPETRYMSRAEREAVRLGLHVSLSETDISVAALALQLSDKVGCKVVVVTDDYALQNLVAAMGFSYMPVRTRGIRRVEAYVAVCPACGYVSKRPGERICPRCGSRLRRARRASSASL
jgi:UPF0271 protein